jgi:hypothetical protein
VLGLENNNTGNLFRIDKTGGVIIISKNSGQDWNIVILWEASEFSLVGAVYYKSHRATHIEFQTPLSQTRYANARPPPSAFGIDPHATSEIIFLFDIYE